ncbi:unnamed protein product [Sphagnum tenellum]
MSTFSVQVRQITQPVIDHPNADRLTIVQIGGFYCIANKHNDGSWRYNVGDYVVYIPEAALVPEWLLRRQGMWDEEKGKGILAGAAGNRVKAQKIRGVVSQGLLYPVQKKELALPKTLDDGSLQLVDLTLDVDGDIVTVTDQQDVAELLSITKYEPPVPTSMTGQVCNIHGRTIKYDLDSIQSFPDMFEIGEPVVVTEKLHGTCVQVGWIPGLNHPELFGKNGNIYVASKGLGAQGLVFKNNAANDGNLYVNALRKLLDDGLEEKLRHLPSWFGTPDDRPDNLSIYIVGEIFGWGVQDLTYGLSPPTLAVFDIAIGDQYLASGSIGNTFGIVARYIGLTPVPFLYEGPYDPDVLIGFRDGMDTISGTNIREGIVIRSADERRHPIHGRKVAKWVSPDYLLRKNKNATEFS